MVRHGSKNQALVSRSPALRAPVHLLIGYMKSVISIIDYHVARGVRSNNSLKRPHYAVHLGKNRCNIQVRLTPVSAGSDHA
jgi:hypothetical protein